MLKFLETIGFFNSDALLNFCVCRATAAGIHLLMGRIGAIFGTNIFGAFVRVNPSIPILIVAGVLLVGGIAALPLSPRKSGLIIH